jgi:hypothetical protein
MFRRNILLPSSGLQASDSVTAQKTNIDILSIGIDIFGNYAHKWVTE